MDIRDDSGYGFILHGAVAYSENRSSLKTFDDAYVICVNGICEGVYEQIPEEFSNLPVEDYWDKLIIPGFTDLHVHAPQYQIRGTGMDLTLMDWLSQTVYPEEIRYKGKR